MSKLQHVRMMTVRTIITCDECSQEKKKMSFIRLPERPYEYCNVCKKVVFWTPKYHIIKYDVFKNESSN